MDDITLRLSGPDAAEFPLGPGVHAVGLNRPGGTLGIVDDSDSALVRFCVDRRGVWMTVGDSAHSVHVNGRPVRRMAMLRRGDAVYVDGFDLLLASGDPGAAIPAGFDDASVDAFDPSRSGMRDGDPRVVLRGVGGLLQNAMRASSCAEIALYCATWGRLTAAWSMVSGSVTPC